MRWKYWNATFVAGCLSVAGLARAQTAPEPATPGDEAEPLVLEGAPDVAVRAIPPAPDAPAPLLVQPGVAPRPTPAALPPGAPAGPYYVAAGRAMAGAGAQPGGAYRVQVVNARAGRDAWIGVAVSPVPPALAHQLRLNDGTGVVVESVYPNTPAQKAGLQEYDVVERIDNQPVAGPEQFSDAVRSHRAGGSVTLAIIREGEPTDVIVKLSRRPASASDQPGTYPPGASPWQPQYGNQAAPKLRFFTPPQPPAAMQGQSYGQPGASPAPPPAGMTPGQPYPELPANPGPRTWGYAKTPAPGVMPDQPYSQPGAPAFPRSPGAPALPPPGGMMQGQPYPQLPAAPGGGGARFWSGAMPPQPAMPGQPIPEAPAATPPRFWSQPKFPQPGMMPPRLDYGADKPGVSGQGSSVRLDYENGRLTATVYSPDGKIMMKGRADVLVNQPGVPSDARRMLKRLRADRPSADKIKSRKEKRKDKDEDQEEEDDAQPRGR